MLEFMEKKMTGSLIEKKAAVLDYVVNTSEDPHAGAYRFVDLLVVAKIELSLVAKRELNQHLRNLFTGNVEGIMHLLAYKSVLYGSDKLLQYMALNPKKGVRVFAKKILTYIGENAGAPTWRVCDALYELLEQSCLEVSETFCLCGDAEAMAYTLAIAGGEKLRKFMEEHPRQ
jgi:hypothetical protein